MKKFISIFMATIMLLSLVGCSSNKTKSDSVLSEDLTKIVEKIYETANFDDKEMNDYLKGYENITLDKSNADMYLGDSNIDFKEGICSEPSMNAIAYELVLLRLDDNADVEAEEVVVENVGNVVLFLMADKEEATPIKEAFLNLANSK